MRPLVVERTALLLLDCQNAIVHPEGPIATAMGFAPLVARHGTLARAAELLASFREAGAAVVHVGIAPERADPERRAARGHFYVRPASGGPSPLAPGSWGGAFHDAVAPVDGELVVGKYPIGAFSRSELDARLQERGITDLVLAGVATHMVVESTTRVAADLGYSVVVAADAVMANDEATHRASLSVQATFADVLTNDEIRSLLTPEDPA